jgi:hypothetical protein
VYRPIQSRVYEHNNANTTKNSRTVEDLSRPFHILGKTWRRLKYNRRGEKDKCEFYIVNEFHTYI